MSTRAKYVANVEALNDKHEPTHVSKVEFTTSEFSTRDMVEIGHPLIVILTNGSARKLYVYALSSGHQSVALSDIARENSDKKNRGGGYPPFKVVGFVHVEEDLWQKQAWVILPG
jgi:hypothetical protein